VPQPRLSLWPTPGEVLPYVHALSPRTGLPPHRFACPFRVPLAACPSVCPQRTHRARGGGATLLMLVSSTAHRSRAPVRSIHYCSGLTYCHCETVASRLPSPPPPNLFVRLSHRHPLARDDNSADQYCGAPIHSLPSAEHACTQVPQQHSSSMLTPLINAMDEDGLSWPQSKSLADGVVDYSSLYVAP
jgi:hypothetical protein